MSRKSFLIALGVVALFVGGGGLTLALLLLHEPPFYANALVAPAEDRQRASKEFGDRCNYVFNSVINPEAPWDVTFTEEQINSYFTEHLATTAGLEKILPEGMTAPRIALEPDRVRLAFRWGASPWSTIVSVEFRVWLAPQEVNVVALEVLGIRAGALPISASSMLERFSETLRRQEVDINWYRYQGHPVALLRFPSAGRTPPVQLRRLSLQDHAVTIGGQPFGYVPVAPPTTPPTSPTPPTASTAPVPGGKEGG
jgi:hypothetical protein